MGMAAGQARLLSITSRMSDNELRAQLINNDKMRLATKSSQASENYVKALNEAQMMFTNYDANNNTSFQNLTFNAMTTFNPYNNQYSLSNASGKPIVSEKDAANFKNATDLNDFLEKYGLEQTTTYFKGLPTVGGQVQYPTTAVDADGNVVFANAGTPAELQKLYEGVENSKPSYENIIASDYYYNYTDKLNTYLTTQEELYATVGAYMLEKLNEMPMKGSEKYQDAIKNINENNVLDYCDAFVDFIKKMLTPGTNNKAYEYLLKDDTTGKIVEENFLLQLQVQAAAAKNGFSVEKYQDANIVEYKDGMIIFNDDVIIKPGDTNAYSVVYNDDGTLVPTVITGSTVIQNANGTYTVKYGTGEEAVEIKNIPAAKTDSPDIEVRSVIPKSEQVNTVKQILRDLQNKIYKVWDPSNDDFVDKSSTEYQNYVAAANDLAQTLGITNLGTELKDYEKLGDISANTFNIPDTEKRNQFNNIVNSIILDNVLNTYGEPKYTWIDTSKPNDSYNVNGEAKAQWYTNLYERMKKTGYEVLKDGLASSSDWIKFALESGVVTMEQVDDSNNWQTIMYSNCSDITEQTDSAAVAKAEAEYNAAMNKIENKDKMYDLELKNIDTEHNSLQTEYDSIKSAIDKNIERTFKLYG